MMEVISVYDEAVLVYIWVLCPGLENIQAVLNETDSYQEQFHTVKFMLTALVSFTILDSSDPYTRL